MNQVIAISDTLYQQLAHNAEQHGFDSIEQLIESLCLGSVAKGDTIDIVEATRVLRLSLQAKYGVLTDTTEEIRQDRER